MSEQINSIRGNIINTVRFGISSLRDTFSDDYHSKDFIYARSTYLRNKVLIIGTIFLALLPFWALLDWFTLPVTDKNTIIIYRAVMLFLLLGIIFLSKYGKDHFNFASFTAGAVIAIPALFYLLILFALPRPTQLLLGYSFIPYMLIAMIAIFPFTLIESFVIGIFLIGVHAFALHVADNLLTYSGLQDLWLLAALLSIALTSNYFQLGLMLRLYREATHDPLTGLLNRGAIMRMAQQLEQRPDTKLSALIMMDLDHFKRINDNYGHMFGDEVLKHFTKTIKGIIDNKGIAARYGGEEFIAIINDTDKQQVLEIAEKIRSVTENTPVINPEGEETNYTVSIGLAMIEPGESFEQAAKTADDRLYEAKEKSRNTVVGF